MKKRFLLSFIAVSMSLSGCSLFKRKNAEDNDPPAEENPPAEVEGLTPAQKEEAEKTKSNLEVLIQSSVSEDASAAISEYLVAYSEEFASKDYSVEKVNSTLQKIQECKFENGILDAFALFGEIGSDGAIDDSIYYAYVFGKSYLRGVAADMTLQAQRVVTRDSSPTSELEREAQLVTNIANFIDKEGDALPNNVIGIADTLYKVYVKGFTVVTMKVVPFISSIMAGEQVSGDSTKAAFEAIGNLIAEIGPMESNITYLVNFGKKAINEFVPQFPPYSDYSDIILPVINFFDFSKGIGFVFDVLEKFGTTLKSLPNSYYAHIDETTSPDECYVYMALELLDNFFEKYDIPSEEIASLFDRLVSLAKSIYAQVNSVYTGIEINSIKSNIQMQLNQFNICLVNYWDEEPLSTIDDVLEWFTDVMGFDKEKGIDPCFENSDYFWDRAENKIVYAQKESAEGTYIGLYPTEYDGVAKTDEWFSLNTYAPQNLELTYTYGIPSYVEKIINSNNLKPIFTSLMDLAKTITELRLESVSTESIARAFGSLSEYRDLTSRHYTTFNKLANGEEIDPVIMSMIPLDEYVHAIETETNYSASDDDRWMTEHVTENGVTTFKIYQYQYSVNIDEYEDEVVYTISEITYTNIQPIADLIYAVLNELANSKATITDKVVDGLGSLYTNARALFNEIKDDLPIEEDDMNDLGEALTIADKFLSGADKELLKTTVQNAIIVLRDLFSAFMPGQDTPAAVDFTYFAIVTATYKPPMSELYGKYSEEQLQSMEVLIGNAYDCLSEAGKLDEVLMFLGMNMVPYEEQPTEEEFLAHPELYYVFDKDNGYELAEEYSSEETYYHKIDVSKQEFVDNIFGLVALMLQEPAA